MRYLSLAVRCDEGYSRYPGGLPLDAPVPAVNETHGIARYIASRSRMGFVPGVVHTFKLK